MSEGGGVLTWTRMVRSSASSQRVLKSFAQKNACYVTNMRAISHRCRVLIQRKTVVQEEKTLGYASAATRTSEAQNCGKYKYLAHVSIMHDQ